MTQAIETLPKQEERAMYENERNTRDMAIAAQTKIDAHVTDCTEFRKVMQATVVKIENNIDILRNDIQSLTVKLSIVVGGIIAIGKIIDVAAVYFHKG